MKSHTENRAISIGEGTRQRASHFSCEVNPRKSNSERKMLFSLRERQKNLNEKLLLKLLNFKREFSPCVLYTAGYRDMLDGCKVGICRGELASI